MNEKSQVPGYKKEYDIIFLGTGIISILEAVYHSRKGKSVLMIDKESEVGGAWKPLNIFGYENVENAIHYFLPDPKSPGFMRDFLGWNVVESTAKYRVLKFPFVGHISFKYDGIISKLINVHFGRDRGNIFARLGATLKLLRLFFLENRPSLYVKGGAPEMIKSIKTILSKSKVEILYQAEPNRIEILPEIVRVKSNKGDVDCSTIYFTHGSLIANLIYSNNKPFPLTDKIHPRPAAHLLIEDDTASVMSECIFVNDPLIKYVHDITHITNEMKPCQKIFVFALQHEVNEQSNINNYILKRLKQVKMIGEKARVIDHHWSDVFLPTLYDSDLLALKQTFGSRVEFLKTENFARGIGYYCEKWKEVINFGHSLKDEDVSR